VSDGPAPAAGAQSAPRRWRCAGSLISRLAGAEDQVFAEWRLRFYGTGIALASAAVTVWKMLRGASVIDATGKPSCIDFCTTWVSGRFAVSADPARIYDYSVFSRAQAVLVGAHHSGFPAYHFWYPPTFLFFTYPLGYISYVAGFAIWDAVTLLLYAASVYAIIPRSTAVIAALTPIVVAENLVLGQTGLLTAAIIGFSLVLLERRPLLAGTALGLLTYKPHFGVLFPLALVAARYWRALAAATVASLTLGGAAAAAFGLDGWLEFFHTLGGRTSSLSLDPGLELILQTVYGLLHWAGANSAAAWTSHLVVAALVSVTVWVLWSRPVPYSLQAAALAVGAVTVTPYVQIYDLCILTIAIAFIVRDGISRGFLAGERIVIVVVLASLYLLLKPFGAIIGVLLLALVLRRIAAFRRPDPMVDRQVAGGVVLVGNDDG
jgi:arabinofuranan 3-O-arabinosyltransferase